MLIVGGQIDKNRHRHEPFYEDCQKQCFSDYRFHNNDWGKI